MPKIKGSRQKEAEIQSAYPDNQLTSIIYGLVMVVAIIVAGAALLGGSMGQVGQRWSAGVDGFAKATGLSLKNVELIGLEHVPDVARQVRIAVMIEPGENMFRADPYNIKRRVEATQLVQKVSVHRLWPDTVMIYATSVEPIALWHNDGDTVLVDSLGRPVPHASGSVSAPSLLQAFGTDAINHVPALVAALSEAPNVRPQIDYARRVSSRRWDLILKSGAIVQLPGDEAMPAAITRLARLEAQSALSRRPLTKIDLRLAQAVYLKPSGALEIEEAA